MKGTAAKASNPLLRANLMRVYQHASENDKAEGMAWYQSAHDMCAMYANRYDLSLRSACGIVAALSPGSSWDKNIADAEAFMRAWADGKRGRSLPLVGSYGWANMGKAEGIAAGQDPLEVLGGNKVRAFYACILQPASCLEVCIDRHAKSAALGTKLGDKPSKDRIAGFTASTSVPKSEYGALAQHYIDAAAKLGILPHQFQAIVWVAWRKGVTQA